MPTHTAACAYDGWYTYTAKNGREGRCYAQVWQPRAGLPVVIVTEPADNPGPSDQRDGGARYSTVACLASPEPRGLPAEAYVDRHRLHSALGERFAEVTFDLDGNALHSPRWRHRERAEVERLIGGPISLPVESSY